MRIERDMLKSVGCVCLMAGAAAPVLPASHMSQSSVLQHTYTPTIHPSHILVQRHTHNPPLSHPYCARTCRPTPLTSLLCMDMSGFFHYLHTCVHHLTCHASCCSSQLAVAGFVPAVGCASCALDSSGLICAVLVMLLLLLLFRM